jgi:hypothetical protein
MGFFNRLKGPKQLQLRHGEHALHEAFGTPVESSARRHCS